MSLAVTAASGQSALPAAARAGVLQRTLNVKSKVNLLEREAEKKIFLSAKNKSYNLAGRAEQSTNASIVRPIVLITEIGWI